MKRILVAATVLISACVGSASAACPNMGPAPRLPSSAADYAARANHSLSEDGILLFDYGASYNNLGKHPDPYFISLYALSLHRDWLSSQCTDETLKAAFIKQAEWLNSSAEWRGTMVVWSHPFENSYYHLEPGWISGIGQSRIASALYRAKDVTGDTKFSTTADGAMETYLRPTTEGGVVVIDGDATWIEEAPDPGGRLYAVLNGHITALSGVYDVLQITGDRRWKDLFDRGVRAVQRDIDKFDAGFASAYSLDSPSSQRPIANLKDYNVLHVSQLIWLYETVGDPTFLYWASRFQAYDENSDVLSAERSINAETHGPENAKALYYNHYWSTSTFPTTFDITLPAPDYVDRIAIDGHTLPTSPADFKVETYRDGNVVWQTTIARNTKQNVDIKLPPMTFIDSAKITFESTVSDEVLALTAVAAVRSNPVFAPVSSDCNYSPDSSQKPMRYNVDRAFDNVEGSVMQIYCPGFIAFPTAGASTFSVHATPADAPIRVSTSVDMLNWSSAIETSASGVHDVPAGANFIMITHTNSISEISEIELRDAQSLWPWPLDFLNPK